MQARSTFLYREEAIPFITVDPKTGKFNINEEAVSLVTSIKGNIGIIAVAGLYRTGKSYLLNRMILDRSSGFGVGPSINPCTKGLWLWGTPLTGQTPEGDPLTILVVDSEGIGALDQDSFHDNRIFSLTLLLSSCFLYNSTGSIDENAIQNLSVIVNITKNIHIKSRPSGTSESDPEEYARYFPSFVWVLRDFALQLVDAQGEPLTPKEYLERTLAQQKGSSESTEQKNKIRKLLRTYFKDRDCFTLVRPLTKEENLQNLEKMDIDELRPEFSRQVIGLRRHILNKMRPKTMNNKILTGAMYAELVRSYVSAINNGAVPNIENTWSLICKSECSKVMTAAIETYETLLKDVLYNKLPLPAEELKNYHIIGKQRAIGLFRRKAIGEVTDEYLRDLIKEIKLKYFNLKLENEREFNRVSNAFIVKEYGAIERKLKNNEYKSFHDFERDVKLFHAYFLENGPNGPNKRVIISEFLQKALYDGANLFIRSSKQESEFQQTLNLDARKKLEQELNELRNGHSKEKQYLVSKISELEYEKSELEVREKNMKTSLNQLRDSKEQNETELRKEWQTEKALAHRMAEDYKAKMEQAEENLKEMERRIYLNDSEQDKQKALLKQKIEHYENMIDQNAVKEKEMMAEIKNLKKEHLSQVRESSTKYDSLNRTLQTKLEEYEQRISELEGDLSLKEQKFELDKKKWKENELNFQRRLGEAQDTVQKLQKELDEKGDVQLLKHEEYREETEMALETLNEKVRALEKTVKDKDELLKTTGNASEKEKCVLSQRNEFLELQLAEMKNQYNEMKRAYDTTLQLFEGANQTTSQEENRKIQELNELHHSEVRKLETELENTRKRLNQQMQQLTEKNNEFELQSKLTSVELNKEIESLREKVTESEQEIQQLNEQVKMTDDKKLKMVQEIEATYLQRIKDLEGDMETQARKAERQLRDIQSSSEESLLQLRNFYEMERERLERRIAEEKDKSEKKLNNLVEEYETKLKEEQGLHEEELTNLREELQEMEMKNNALVQQYESDSDLKLQTISSLENYVKETKENLSHIHTSNAQILKLLLTLILFFCNSSFQSFSLHLVEVS